MRFPHHHVITVITVVSSAAALIAVLLLLFYSTRSSIRPLIQTYNLVPVAKAYAWVDVETAMWLGEYYFSSDNYDSERAEHYYRRAIALEPTRALAHYQLGRIAFIRGRFIEAQWHIDQSLRYDPAYYRGYYMRGLIAGYEKNYKLAAESFYTFLQYDSIGWAGYNDLSWVYFQQGNYPAAAVIAEFGLGYAPENAWLHNSLGVALLAQGEKARARQHFQKALERVDTMKPEDWGIAYPGNDPTIYAEGLESMRESIVHNLAQ
ncbi:MAG: tetratricopeptide repeat protein [Candidatus Pacebacteria bacterium]|nr:tetratricopeptide repeat protein [Candidatus Paceibacterota bacterium]